MESLLESKMENLMVAALVDEMDMMKDCYWVFAMVAQKDDVMDKNLVGYLVADLVAW